MGNYVGKKVFCKRNGATGIVSEQDSLTITINIEDVEKSYTHRTFDKWWVVIPEDNQEPEPQEEEFVPTNELSYDANGLPLGQPGIGVVLRDKFMSLIRDLDLDEVLIFHDPDKKTDVVKFNGVNVFECIYANRRFNVLAHPKSLTPMNRKKITVEHPPEWGWSLRAKFVFTSLNQWPLMKSIINDGMFYRSELNKHYNK